MEHKCVTPADLQSLADNARVMYFDVSGALIFHVIARPELTPTSGVNRGECSCNHSGGRECVHVRLHFVGGKSIKLVLAISLSHLKLVLIVP